MDVKIREAKEEDLGKVAKMQKQLMEHHRAIDKYYSVNKAASSLFLEHIRKIIETGDGAVFVAEDKNKIIGYLKVRLNSRSPVYKEIMVGCIDDAFVIPECRGHGVNKKLVAAGINWLKARGVKTVELVCFSKNKMAVNAWTDSGFTVYEFKMKKSV